MSEAAKPNATHGNMFFDEATSVDVVNARMGEQVDPRLKEVMAVVVKHLHAAIKEIEPTHEEWLAAIQFLTATGQMCNDWRQEYILLSDILGVSMLVDAINHRRPNGATPNTILGPFYVENSPVYKNGQNICLDGKGEPLYVSGYVKNTQGEVLPNATVEVWQTNNDGFYDVQQKGIQPEFNLRGTFITDENGFYSFKSVKPRHYPIPNDGPVGQLLEKMGRHPNRASHLHFIVQAYSHESIITHIFTPDCQYLEEDSVFGVKEDLIADFKFVSDKNEAEEVGFNTPFWKVDWDFVLSDKKPLKA